MARRREEQVSRLVHHQEYSDEEAEQWLREIREKAEPEIKIKLSQKSSKGDDFIKPLHKIHRVLQHLAMRHWQAGIAGSDHTEQVTDQLQLGLQLLTAETIPVLVMSMGNIISETEEMGKLLLDVISYLMAVELASPISFPALVASALLYLNRTWTGASQHVIYILCHYAFPLSLLYPNVNTSPMDSMSVTTTLTLILEEGLCQPKHHLYLVETLMYLKREVCTDLLSVMAYGTTSGRKNALQLLLYYWPLDLPDYTQSDYGYPFPEKEIPKCDTSACEQRATTLCLDGACASQFSKKFSTGGSKRLYILLCPRCDSVVHKSFSISHRRVQIPKPLLHLDGMKQGCELQCACLGSGTTCRAVVTCYADSCTAGRKGRKPVRMCHDCHLQQHSDLSDPHHIYQVSPCNPWDSGNAIAASTLLEAISKLLDSTPHKVERKESRRASHASQGPTARYSMEVDFGCKNGLLMLEQYCTPSGDLTDPRKRDWLVHLIARVLEWLRLCHELIQEMTNATDQLQIDTESLGQGSLIIDFQSEVEKVCSNYRRIHFLINEHAVPWLRSVCESKMNTKCFVEALKPDLPGYAQVGKYWQHTFDSMERYKRTLSIVALLVQNSMLPENSLFQVYNEIMPQWMDLLVEMHQTPGQMEHLKSKFHDIFSAGSTETHQKRFRKFEFIREKFIQREQEARQRALFWLQDLSRLAIPVPYTSHIFEESLHQRKGLWRQEVPQLQSSDELSSYDLAMPPSLRKDSTGSMSGYESESPLVSQSSFDVPTAAGVLVQLAFALPRYILMLDVWLSQLNLHDKGVPLEFSKLQRFLCLMLSREWGTSHSFADHHDVTNLCLLCQATAIWFNLATRIISYYAEDVSEYPLEADPASPIPARKPSAYVARIRGSRKKRVDGESGHGSSPATPQKTLQPADEADETWEYFDGGKKISIAMGVTCDDAKEEKVERDPVIPAAAMIHSRSPRDRRQAISSRHSQVKLSAAAEPSLSVTADDLSTLAQSREGEEQLSQLYMVFRKCAEKLGLEHHPDATTQIIQFLLVMLRPSVSVFDGISKDVLHTDLPTLLNNLWKLLESDNSYMARMCVGLLLECQHHLARLEVVSLPLHLANSTLWKILENGFKPNKPSKWKIPFRTVDRLGLILQFMPGKENEAIELWKPDQATEATLAYGFCLLVLQLQDKDSKVCTRTQYCLSALKQASLEKIRSFLLVLFVHLPSHMELVLQSLTLLNSALPTISFLSWPLITQLLNAADQLVKSQDPDEIVQSIHSTPQPTSKKVSDTSVLSARGRETRPSTASSAFSIMLGDDDRPAYDPTHLHCEIIAVLLKYIANSKSDFNRSLENSATPRFPTKRATLFGNRPVAEDIVSPADNLVNTLDTYVCRNLHLNQLRQSQMLEIFIVHIYKVLDHNSNIGKAPKLISFLLRLLGLCPAPSARDFQPQDGPKALGCRYSLALLPLHLQEPWMRVLFVVLYKYSHVVLQSEESKHLLLWCIGIVVNTVKGSSSQAAAVQLSEGRPSHNRLVKQPTLTTLPDSPTSPSIAEGATFTIGQRPSGMERRQGLATVPEESSSSSLHVAPAEPPGPTVATTSEGLVGKVEVPTSSPSKMAVTHTPSIASMTSILTASTGVDQSAAANNGFSWRDKNPFSEEVVALGVVCLGTCTHRMPSIASEYLVSEIIPCIARVVVPGHYPWQEGSIEAPPPGSALSVAKQFLLMIFTQFAERRIFIHLFRYDHGEFTDALMEAIVGCLVNQQSATGEEGVEMDTSKLTVTSPIEFFIEDASSSVSFREEVTGQSLMNLSSYLDKLTLDMWSGSLYRIPHIEVFLKKIKEHDLVLKDSDMGFCGFLRLVIHLLKGAEPPPGGVGQLPQLQPLLHPSSHVAAIMQDLPEVLTDCLQHRYCPVGGLINLVNLWHAAYQQSSAAGGGGVVIRREPSKKLALFRALLECFGESLKTPRKVLLSNIFSMTQMMLFFVEPYVYLGYVDSLAGKRDYAPNLKLGFELNISAILNNDRDTAGMESLFSEVMREALRYLAFSQVIDEMEIESVSQVKLLLAQLVAFRVHRQHQPMDLLKKIIQGSPNFIIDKSTKSKVHSGSTGFGGDGSMNSLFVIGWVLLGTLAHNTVYDALQRGRMGNNAETNTTLCNPLIALFPSLDRPGDRSLDKMENATTCIIRRVLAGLRFINAEPAIGEQGFRCILLFSTIWTVYLELGDFSITAVPEIADFWQKLMNKILKLPEERFVLNIGEMCNYFIQLTLIPLKRAGVSSFQLMLPTWKGILKLGEGMAEYQQGLAQEYQKVQSATPLPIDLWYREIIGLFTALQNDFIKTWSSIHH